ncbi:MAG: class IV adenylate cyclase [Halanaeroarchaeum sp.]
MYEVEVKVRADHDRVEAALEESGAAHLETIRQADTYYNAPHRDFAATDEALRVRRERRDGGVTAKVTYKGPKIDGESKTREEHETAVDDAVAIDEILNGLGFTPAATVEKERRRYDFDSYTVTLDTVTDLGDFVEIETDVEDEAAVERAREDLQIALAALGLDPEESIRTSYLGLLLNNSE